MPVDDGLWSLSSDFTEADRYGSTVLPQSIAASIKYVQVERLRAFTHVWDNAFAGDDVVPWTSAKGAFDEKDEQAEAFKPKKLSALAWRCLPFLWRPAPGTTQLEVTLTGAVLEDTDGGVDLCLTVGSSHPDLTRVINRDSGDGTHHTLTVEIPSQYWGHLLRCAVWYRGTPNITDGSIANGECQPRAGDDRYWQRDPVHADVVSGFTRTLSGTIVNSWPVATEPAPSHVMYIFESGDSFPGDNCVVERQVMFYGVTAGGASNDGTVLLWGRIPTVDAVTIAPAGSLQCGTTYDWYTYALSYIALESLQIREISMYSGTPQASYEPGRPVKGARTMGLISALNAAERENRRVYQVYPCSTVSGSWRQGVGITGNPDYRTGDAWRPLTVVPIYSETDVADVTVDLLVADTSLYTGDGQGFQVREGLYNYQMTATYDSYTLSQEMPLEQDDYGPLAWCVYRCPNVFEGTLDQATFRRPKLLTFSEGVSPDLVSGVTYPAAFVIWVKGKYQMQSLYCYSSLVIGGRS